MKNNWTICSGHSKRRGLTLFEVVAATVVLGTILVGIVLSKSRHTRQLGVAKRQDRAVRAVDEMISGWWASTDGVPINESGQLGPDATLTWSTRLIENEPLAELGARVLRVDVRQADIQQDGTPSGSDLFSVDLVLRDPEWVERHAPDSGAESVKGEG